MNTYSIKIALRGISPMIWRRLRVAGSTSLADLHHIIQIAMGWDDDYLHHFHIHGVDHGIHKPGCNPFRYDPEEVFIDDLEFEMGDRFTYTYNYFEFWICDVRIEVIDQSTKAVPRCFGGSGRKGNRNYYKIDEVIAGSELIEQVALAGKSLRLRDLHSWLESYDSIRFSRPTINKQLKESFPAQRY